MSDLLMLLEELHWLSSKWYMLGIQLRLSPDALDNIRRQSSDPGDCLRETLIVWLKTTPNPTWKMVIDALRRRSLGEHRLAFSLEAKYGSTAGIILHLPVMPQEKEYILCQHSGILNGL